MFLCQIQETNWERPKTSSSLLFSSLLFSYTTLVNPYDSVKNKFYDSNIQIDLHNHSVRGIYCETDGKTNK